MGNMTRQKNKRGDSKVESNDSPEIPDRGETSDIPGLPSGALPQRRIEPASAARRSDALTKTDTSHPPKEQRNVTEQLVAQHSTVLPHIHTHKITIT